MSPSESGKLVERAELLYEAVTLSPFHIAYCPALRLRLGPFQRADGRRWESGYVGVDAGTEDAIRHYTMLDSWTWTKQLTAEMLLADWFPGLPASDPITLLAWLTGGRTVP